MKLETLDFPAIRLFRNYQRQWLMTDLLAGIAVCVVMIPSVMAYAELGQVCRLFMVFTPHCWV